MQQVRYFHGITLGINLFFYLLNGICLERSLCKPLVILLHLDLFNLLLRQLPSPLVTAYLKGLK